MNRREALKAFGALPLAVPLTASITTLTGCRESPHANQSESRQAKPANNRPLQPTEPVPDQSHDFDARALTLLDEIRERGAHYFMERTSPRTGLICDRAPANGTGEIAGKYAIASIAATGFGLSAQAIAAQHHLLPQESCTARLMSTLEFLANEAPHEHGFFPHFLDVHTGQRQPGSEYSSIDTTLLLFGALHARHVLNSAKADRLVQALFDRVDWQWMQNAPNTPHDNQDKPAMLSMGWMPETGFLSARWTSFSECTLMYAVAIASPTHGLPASIWDQIERSVYDYGGIRFISSYGALFIHQYPHLWLDLRNMRDRYGDPCRNATLATRAHKTWCMLQHERFPWVDERLWGFSASDKPDGNYIAWGAPPEVGIWDGTIAPHAAAGSLVLLPEECSAALLTMREHYPQSFERFGFVDAFNPGANKGQGWFDPDVIGIDVGLTMLMAENLRTRSVQQAATNCSEIQRAMKEIGFYRTDEFASSGN